MSVLSACVCLYTTYVSAACGAQEEELGPLELELEMAAEPPYECWESNPGPLREQALLN